MATARVHHGTEGPAHDPYGYTEVTFTRTDGLSATYHGGLVEWTEVGDGRRDHRVASGDESAAVFEAITGVHPAAAMRLAERIENPRRCRKCGRKDRWEHVSGYPGETLRICSHCEAISSARVNWSAIE